MEVAVGQQPGAYHRAWSLFLLDHDRQGTQVLEAAEAELAARRDIYGYDLLAWALYKQGRPLEARRAMANALAQGTQDAMLFFHAGMIERAAGNAAAARDFLSRALAVAPAFDPSAASIAQAVIDTLARAAGMSSRAAGTHAVAGARAVGG
jgi:tetratricopeptide (TPR) repeat protein